MNEIGFACLLAGPGRGDCLHFVGLPGKSIPGQHDGPDDTVDVYGKPNGWCWSCWRSYQIVQLRSKCAKMEEALEKLARLGNEPELGNSIGNRIAQAALSSDAGKGFIPVKELEPVINWFKSFLSGWDEKDRSYLEDRHPGAAAGEVCVCDVLDAVKLLARLESLAKGAGT